MLFLTIASSDFAKRSHSSADWSSGTRWAFFALLLIAIALTILGTLKINRNRLRRGIAPLYGTTWLTPPAYRRQPEPNNQETYVPTYTATANEADMGYYDQQGNFHQNPNVKSPGPPQAAHLSTDSGYTVTDTSPTGAYVNLDSHFAGYDRPMGPGAPGYINEPDHLHPRGHSDLHDSTLAGASSHATTSDTPTTTVDAETMGNSQPVYARPDVPPPTQSKS